MPTKVRAPSDAVPGLIRTTGILGVAAVVARLCNLGVVSALSHSAGTEAVGQYGLATLTASFLSLAGSLGFPTYLTRNRAAGLVDDRLVSGIHALRFVALVVMSFGLFAAIRTMMSLPIAIGFWAFATAALLDQWNETAWATIRGTSSAWREAAVNGATYAGLLVLAATGALTHHLSFETCGLAAIAFGVLRACFACLVTKIRWVVINTEVVRDAAFHVKPALPYLASDVLGLAYLRGDTFVLAGFVSAANLGEYVAAATFTAPLIQVASSMSMGAVASASRRSTQNRPQTKEVVAFFVFGGLATTSAVCALITPVSQVLYGAGSQHIAYLTLILAVFLPIRYLNFALSSITLAEGRAIRRLQIVVASAVFNIALNFVIDRWFGTSGAAWATVLTEVLVTALFLLGTQKRVKIIRPVVTALVPSVVCILVMATMSDSSNVFAGLVLGSVCLVGVLPNIRNAFRPINDHTSDGRESGDRHAPKHSVEGRDV